MNVSATVPVITIDGLSASGKGTIAMKLAEHLSWHLLDSGALYRAFVWGFVNDQLQHAASDYQTVIDRLEVRYLPNLVKDDVFLSYSGAPIQAVIRQEQWGQLASKFAAIPAIREALLPLQRQARRLPGLVADGRDMGSVIFPDASLKFYLEAAFESRAERRFNQLKQKEINVSLDNVRQELAERDYRDKHRPNSPARCDEDMILIDTTHLSIEQVFKKIMDQVNVVI